MKLYAILSENRDWSRYRSVLPEHLDYLGGLQSDGRLVAAGLFEGDSGGLMVVSAASLEEASELADQEPFHSAGIRSNVAREWNLTRLFGWRLDRSQPLLRLRDET